MAQNITGLVFTDLTSSQKHANFGTKVTGTDSVGYAIQGEVVYLRGTTVVGGTIAAGTAIATLPVEARPSVKRFVTRPINDGGSYVGERFIIDTDGTIKLTVVTLASNDEIYFDGISFVGPGPVVNA